MGPLPEGWIWRPVSFHDRLSPSGRGRVLRWFYLGGAGFVFVVLGIIAVATAVLAEVA